MLPIFMIQSQVFWLRGKPLRNIQPFNGFAPMQDIERLLNKMFPKNSALVLILLHARKLDGRFYLSGGSWSVLWPGSTIPAVFPKTMKCLSVLHKLFAPLLLSALYSSGFSLLVQLLSVEDIADTLAIGRNKAYSLVNSGVIKALKIGQHYRIPRDEFIKFVKNGVQNA